MQAKIVTGAILLMGIVLTFNAIRVGAPNWHTAIMGFGTAIVFIAFWGT